MVEFSGGFNREMDDKIGYISSSERLMIGFLNFQEKVNFLEI